MNQCSDSFLKKIQTFFFKIDSFLKKNFKSSRWLYYIVNKCISTGIQLWKKTILKKERKARND